MPVMTGIAMSKLPSRDHGEKDGAALEELRRPLAGFFRRRIREQHDVADLVQDVFLRLSNRNGSEEIRCLRGYAFQIAGSVLTDRQRYRSVRHLSAHVDLDPERVGDGDVSPDRILIGRETLEATVDALNRLPARTRTIFVLRRLEGLRYMEIAKRFGISVSAVEKHMKRAVAHLSKVADRGR